MSRRVTIVGGGAAGFFAAAMCAESAESCDTVILEKSGQPLGKVASSGGGRCNLTNAVEDLRAFAGNYCRGSRELIGPLHTFGPRQTMAWFEDHGVPLKLEPDGRVFPASDRAADVVDCLVDTVRSAGVEVRTGHCVVGLARVPGGGYRLRLQGGDSVSSDIVLLAPGGGRNVRYDLAEALGHTIVPPVPSLFGFTLDESWLTALAGVSLADVRVHLPEWHVREHGPLLITHQGLSGPAVIGASSRAARELAFCRYSTVVILDWVPHLTADSVLAELKEMGREIGRKSVDRTARFGLPASVWSALVRHAGIDGSSPWARLSNASKGRLAGLLKGCQLRMCGKASHREEMVTCGGVALNEVNFKTMESRINPGLFLAGEFLNMDGLTGGFNLQAAWTTGAIAGRAAS